MHSSDEPILIRGRDLDPFLAWLSWSLHCYGCGVGDTRARALGIASIGAGLGLVAGFALGAAL